MIGFYDNWNEQQYLSKVFRLQTLLAGLTANFRLAVVIQKIGSTQSAVWETDRDIDFLRLTTLSKTSGVAFSHPEDAEFFNSNLDAKYKLE